MFYKAIISSILGVTAEGIINLTGFSDQVNREQPTGVNWNGP
jgi:hypothetical protein